MRDFESLGYLWHAIVEASSGHLVPNMLTPPDEIMESAVRTRKPKYLDVLHTFFHASLTRLLACFKLGQRMPDHHYFINFCHDT